MKISRENNHLTVVTLATATLCTLLVNPWLALDPINIIKQSALFLGASLIAALVISQFRSYLNKNRVVLVVLGFWIAALTISYFVHFGKVVFAQQTWGAWGRSTGTLTFIAFAILIAGGACINLNSASTVVFKWFDRCTYTVAAYTILQYAALDPINWSQKDTFATLGNINFMSGFLGLAISLLLGRVLLQNLPYLTKIFYISLAATYSALIYFSGSLQGLIMSAAAFFVAVLIRLYSNLRAFWLITFSFVATLTFSILGLAVFGKGILGAKLVQQTMLYRTDYWRAGMQMFRDYPIFGLGQDSYGDYYRQFRDVLAVTRTGPNRYTNTAHNVFLDLAVGSGLMGILPLSLLVILVLMGTIKSLKSNLLQHNTALVLFPAWISFLVFCMISINQIGVSAWGFIFTGILLGNISQSETKLGSSLSNSKNRVMDKELTNVANKINVMRTWLSYAAFLIVGLILSAPPNFADSGFYLATKSKNLQNMERYAFSLGSQDSHRELLISNYVDAKNYTKAYETARRSLEINSRNFYFNVAILESFGIASPAEVREAAERLTSLDPLNSELQKRIDLVLAGLKDSQNN